MNPQILLDLIDKAQRTKSAEPWFIAEMRKAYNDSDDGIQEDALRAINLIEEKLPGAGWTLCRITNKHHSAMPYGAGFAVTVACGDGAVAWEKTDTSFTASADRAIRRVQNFIESQKGETL